MTNDENVKIEKEEYTEITVRVGEIYSLISEYLKDTNNKLPLISAQKESSKLTKDLVNNVEFDLRDHIEMDEIDSNEQEYIN